MDGIASRLEGSCAAPEGIHWTGPRKGLMFLRNDVMSYYDLARWGKMSPPREQGGLARACHLLSCWRGVGAHQRFLLSDTVAL